MSALQQTIETIDELFNKYQKCTEGAGNILGMEIFEDITLTKKNQIGYIVYCTLQLDLAHSIIVPEKLTEVEFDKCVQYMKVKFRAYLR